MIFQLIFCFSRHVALQESKVDFELAEGLYAQAIIPETHAVCLWLGANVMLEYRCDEVLVKVLALRACSQSYFDVLIWVYVHINCISFVCVINKQAQALLKKNLENANISLQAIVEDLHFLRDQVTITEVQHNLS